MALVLGFYVRLIAAIHNISPTTFKVFFGSLLFNKEALQNLKSETERIDAFFLIKLGIGAMLAIVALAEIMTFLLIEWHNPTYGFFFGLVLLSVVSPYRLIQKKSLTVIILVIIGAASVWGVSNTVSSDDLLEKAQKKHEIKLQKDVRVKDTGGSAASGPARSAISYLAFFIMGIVAISGMVLPGISGSFLLLLMGGYFEILTAIVNRDFTLLGIFALGCVVGILLFTRLLNYLLTNFHDHTLGVLLGLVIGSLWAIWPFKHSVKVGTETVYLDNRIPEALGSAELLTILTTIIGMIVVYVFLKFEKE